MLDVKEKQGFVYCWVNKINFKWYIGSHKGCATDGYITSGVALKRAIKKYGIVNFERKILYEGLSFREIEGEVLELLEARQDSRSYNMHNKAIGREGPLPEKTKQKISSTLKGHTYSKKGKENPLFGIKLSEGHKEKIRLGLKNTESLIGEKNGMFGKKHNNETLKILSEKHSGPNNGMYNRKHSNQTKELMALKATSRIASNETKEKMSRKRFGVHLSENHKNSISEGSIGKKYVIVRCNWCGKEGGNNAMIRYHFDNCKDKK